VAIICSCGVVSGHVTKRPGVWKPPARPSRRGSDTFTLRNTVVYPFLHFHGNIGYPTLPESNPVRKLPSRFKTPDVHVRVRNSINGT